MTISTSLVKADTATKTMSSREIAELTGKQHKDVIRDIRVMLDALQKDGADLRHVREDKDARGYTKAFHLNRELTDTLLTGYSVPLRRKVIARWHELESKQLPPTTTVVKDPQLAAMVLMLTQLDSVKQEQQAQRVELSDIRAKITATPEQYYTVAGYASLRGLSIDTSKANLLGRKATKISREHDIEVGKAHSSIYGEVNTYHVDVLCEAFKAD